MFRLVISRRRPDGGRRDLGGRADRSAALQQHMRLMETANPGMERMMEAPALQMPPSHP